MNPSPDLFDTVKKELKKRGLAPPQTLTFGIIDKCNLRCQHCWLECGPRSEITPVDRKTVVHIVDEFQRLGGKEIWLAGGETLLHPEWEEILVDLNKFFSLSTVGIQTNGTLITQEIAERLSQYDHSGFTIQISLDGATSDTHDIVRGKGSFKLAMAGLKRLCRIGVNNRIIVAYTEMRHSYLQLPLLLKIVDEFNLKGLVSNSLIMDGRANSSKKIQPPSPDQIIKLIKTFHSDTTFQDRYHRLGTISAIEWFNHKHQKMDNACHCISTPYLTPKGRLYPCVMFQNDALSATHVFKRSLTRSIRDHLDQWVSLPKAFADRKAILSDCLGCAGYDHCGGGCAGRAFAAFGDSNREEDRCELRKAVYYWDKNSN